MANPAAVETGLIEKGDIYFLYRPKVETEKVRGRQDVQRFFMLLSPDSEGAERIYRLFVVGRKKLPEVREGESHPEERNWALNVKTVKDPKRLKEEFRPTTYATETKGQRFVAAAEPVGEGRYEIFHHNNHTELAYALTLPKEPGPAQEEFEIKDEASYIIAVKNPEVTAPGVPAPQEKPHYPARLLKKFGDHRWIAADDPKFLDFENTQLLLLGARTGAVKEELDLEIDEKAETMNTASVCRELKLCKPETGELLRKGVFPAQEDTTTDVKELSSDESPTKAAKRGGMKGRETASSSGIARVLKGVGFPKKKKEIIGFATRHKTRVKEGEKILKVLRELPDRQYRSMAQLMEGLGKVR